MTRLRFSFDTVTNPHHNSGIDIISYRHIISDKEAIWLMYVGIDLHKKYMQIAVIDEDGQTVSETRVNNDTNQYSLKRFLNTIPDDSQIVMESCNVWRRVYRYIQDRGFSVILSDPFKTRAIASAKIKTDKIDAMTLATLLRAGMIPAAYVAPPDIMDLRDMVRHRFSLVNTRRRAKTFIHGTLLMEGVKIHGNPFTKKYIEALRNLHNYRIDNYLDVIGTLNDTIKKTDADIRTAVRKRNENDARLLMTIPGIGYYSALLIVSEIGDIGRFPDSHHLSSYAGLVPSTYSSGGRTQYGRITKRGSRHLRWILNECVNSNKRTKQNNDIMSFYHRLNAKKGPQKATTAAASKLARMIFWVLKEQREFVPNMPKVRKPNLASQSRKAAVDNLRVKASLS